MSQYSANVQTTGSDTAVIIPVYNRKQTVLETLHCVAAQERLPRQVIIVDDGSSDGTGEAVKQWLHGQTRLTNTTVIRQKNRGVSAARNRGFTEIGDCPYVTFLDSDDLWPVDFLARSQNVLAANPGAIAVTSDQVFCGLQRRKRFRSTSALAKNATAWLFRNDGAIGSSSVFRSETLRRLGCYDESLPTGEDIDLFLRVSLTGPWLHTKGEPVIYQRGLCGKRGEETNLSEKFSDSCRHWALIHENFICQTIGKQYLDHNVCRNRLAYCWYRAGRQLMRSGRVDEARHCFRRSLTWRLWQGNTWFRLAQTLWSSPD